MLDSILTCFWTGGSGSNLTSDGKGGFSKAMKDAMHELSPEMLLKLEEEVAKLTTIAKQAAAAVELEESKKKARADGDHIGDSMKEVASHSAIQRYDSLSSSVRSVTHQLRVVLEGKFAARLHVISCVCIHSTSYTLLYIHSLMF